MEERKEKMWLILNVQPVGLFRKTTRISLLVVLYTYGYFYFRYFGKLIICWESVHVFYVYVIYIHVYIHIYCKIILNINFIYKFMGLMEYSYS